MQVTVNITQANINGAKRSATADPIARALNDAILTSEYVEVAPKAVLVVDKGQILYGNLPVEGQRVVTAFDMPARKGGGRKAVQPTSFNVNLMPAVGRKEQAFIKLMNHKR